MEAVKVSELEETHGPRVGLKLTQEQAQFILQRHNLGIKCEKLTWVDRGFNNMTYFIKSNSLEEYVIRLSGINWKRMKTENEVASILYLRKNCPALLLPKILGFCSDKSKSLIGCEYILMEKLQGTPLDTFFADLSFDDLKKVVEQVVHIFGSLKSLSFTNIGSLQFRPEIGDTFGLALNLDEIDPDLDIQVGPGLEAKGGPFPTYLEFLKTTLFTELHFLRNCPFLLEGAENFADRIEAFITLITEPEVTPLSQDVFSAPVVFAHGDFEPRNLLVDRNTLKVTGVLDFEFSGAFPIDEDWVSGLQWFGSDTAEWVVYGDDKPLYENETGLSVEDLVKIKTYFLEQCEIQGVKTPDKIPGHYERALLYHFKANISPWWMREPIDDPSPSAGWLNDRAKARQRVATVLEKYGY